MKDDDNFSYVQARSKVEIHLPDGRVISGPRGAEVGDFLKFSEINRNDETSQDDSIQSPIPIVGAIVNHELHELTYSITQESEVIPVTMADTDGMRIYRRSLTFLLETAFEELFPDAVLTVDHSVSSGGYFCQVLNRPNLTDDELQSIDKRMRFLVQADVPFMRKEVPIHEAIEYFSRKGHYDKVRILKYRHKDYLTLYELEENWDYHHGYLVPSTGYLRWFGLVLTNGGFTLRFPRRHRPTELLPLPDYPKLLHAFQEYGRWLDRLGIASVGTLNEAIGENRSREVILVSEALQEQRIADIADLVDERVDRVQIIMIAGPSASGKTTFSKRLSIQLLAHGISPFHFEMDNYFVNREATPRDENGQLDYESEKAINTEQMGVDLQRLIAGEAVQLPKFNFYTGKQEPGDIVTLQPGQLIIVEGIHGLNPGLLPTIPSSLTYRIYVSALTQLNLDHQNRVSTTDTRLLRRIVRDARERGYSASDTIQRWESVRRGEKRYIFPYQENADVMFNSALVYELSVLKPLAEPLLRQVPYGCEEYVEAKRLLAFLEWFLPLESDMIPDNSILREFIGGSILREFKLWNSPS